MLCARRDQPAVTVGGSRVEILPVFGPNGGRAAYETWTAYVAPATPPAPVGSTPFGWFLLGWVAVVALGLLLGWGEHRLRRSRAATAPRPGNLFARAAFGRSVPSRLALAAVLLVVGTLADVGSTYLAITTGEYVEGSPVGGALITLFGPLRGMVITKAVGMVLIGVPVAIAGGSRRLVATLMCGGVGLLSILAAARNLLMLAGVW